MLMEVVRKPLLSFIPIKQRKQKVKRFQVVMIFQGNVPTVKKFSTRLHFIDFTRDITIIGDLLHALNAILRQILCKTW